MPSSRTVVLNIEANGLTPDKIWCINCKDADTNERRIFRGPDFSSGAFSDYWTDVGRVVGHNLISYDLPVLKRLIPRFIEPSSVVDTLVVSRLLDYNRAGGHSLAAWGPSVGLTKGPQPPWHEFSEDLVSHSQENVEITHALYKAFQPYLTSDRWQKPIETELFVAQVCQQMHENGFHFDLDKATKLRYTILEELEKLDEEIKLAFPPKVRKVRSITPRLTKFGTLNRNDFRWAGPDLSHFNGGPFSLIEYEDFNPGSTSQIIERLNEAGWQPTEKTKGHNLAIREKDQEKLARFAKTGWTVSETNLMTLPDTAPAAAKKLALRITLASRSRTLLEWINAYNPETGRVHGSFNGLGAWTHRMSHVRPNTGNIPTPQPLDKKSSELQIRAHEIDSLLRTYWQSAPGSYLVGVDAEGIQLRVLAHYINDPRFTAAVTEGNKEDGTDPHSLNKVALGAPCKSRNHAKTFIYAWLLGAGVGKVAQILECSGSEAKRACDDFIEFYPGLQLIKKDIIPRDASRGYFEGFDGRYVTIVGEDQGSREHFTLAGYLQNGETVVMKRAMQLWYPQLVRERIPFKIVNFVHDEFQTEVQADYGVAEYVAKLQADSIRQAGEDLGLRCPMAGSILSGHGKIAIGANWSETH